MLTAKRFLDRRFQFFKMLAGIGSLLKLTRANRQIVCFFQLLLPANESFRIIQFECPMSFLKRKTLWKIGEIFFLMKDIAFKSVRSEITEISKMQNSDLQEAIRFDDSRQRLCKGI